MLESMLEQICGPDLFTDIYDTLSVNLFSAGGKFSAALSVVRGIYNMAMPIGVMLMFIYFLIALIDKVTSENFTWEALWRQLAMLLASKVILEHGFELLELLSGIGMSAMHMVSSAGSAAVTSGVLDYAAIIDDFEASLHLTGFFEWLGDFFIFIFLLVPFLGSWLMKIFVSVICYSRVIEIYVRAAFAPIALSDFFHSGFNGAGWKFLKNFLASCLQGAIILVIAIVYSGIFAQITYDATWNIFKFLGVFLAVYASAVMLMFKSLSLAKDLVGTN